ncbi:unnamed protein product, partial [Prorocentrum cordatum]
MRMLLEDAEVPADLDEASREAIFNEMCREAREERLEAFGDALLRLPLEALGLEATFEEACAAVCQRLGTWSPQGVPQAELKCAWEDWRRVRIVEHGGYLSDWLRECGHFAEAARSPEAREGRGPAFAALCAELAK